MLNPQFHHFDIKLGRTGAESCVKMDGEVLRLLQNIEVSVTANELTKVRLEMFATVDMEGEVPDGQLCKVYICPACRKQIAKPKEKSPDPTDNVCLECSSGEYEYADECNDCDRAITKTP